MPNACSWVEDAAALVVVGIAVVVLRPMARSLHHRVLNPKATLFLAEYLAPLCSNARYVHAASAADDRKQGACVHHMMKLVFTYADAEPSA